MQLYHDGLGRWFEISAYCPAPGQFAAVSRDITAQRESDQLRQIQEERLRLALAGAELGMWDWQAQTGDFTYDERWAEIVGYDGATIPATLERLESSSSTRTTARA